MKPQEGHILTSTQCGRLRREDVKTWLSVSLPGGWIALIGYLMWIRSYQSRQPPPFDPLDDIQKTEGTWNRLRHGLKMDSLLRHSLIVRPDIAGYDART
jgi:hypothetical protein